MRSYSKLLLVSLLSLLSAAPVSKTFEIFHITDTHANIAGDPQNPGRASLPQVVEFHRHMNEQSKGATFFIHSGDITQGSALSDADTPIPGLGNFLTHFADPEFIATVGNHDLDNGIVDYTIEQSTNNTSVFKDRYIATNLFSTVNNSAPTPFTGTRFITKTVNGTKMLIIGFLDETWTYKPSYVTLKKCADSLDADFASYATTADPDMVLVLQHSSITDGGKYLPQQAETVERIREVLGDDMPILFLNGHAHHWEESPCYYTNGTVAPNCYHRQGENNLRSIAFVNVNITKLDNGSVTANFTLTPRFDNNIKNVRSHMGLAEDAEFPCGSRCSAVNDTLNSLVNKIHPFDVLATSTRNYTRPSKPQNWLDRNCGYYLWNKYIHPIVYNGTDIFLINTGSVKGDIREGAVKLDNVFAFAPYSEHRATSSGVSAKTLYALVHKVAPSNEDPSSWADFFDGGDSFYLNPPLSSLDINKTYNLVHNTFDRARIAKAASIVGDTVTQNTDESIDLRSEIHKALINGIQLDSALDETTTPDNNEADEKAKMPGWAWVLVAISIAIFAGIMVGSGCHLFKRQGKTAQV